MKTLGVRDVLRAINRGPRIGQVPAATVEEREWTWPWTGTWSGGFFSSQAAPYVAPGVDHALRNAASLACMDVLADAIGRVPFDVVRGDGPVRQYVTPPPQVIANPSGLVQTDVWRNQLGWSLVTDGNAFGLITSMTNRAWPNTMELIDPSTVVDRQVVGGIPQVRIVSGMTGTIPTVADQVHQLWPHGDLWHCPGRIIQPGTPFALSPIHYAARTICTSLAAEDFSSQFFTSGGHPSSIIYSKRDITATQAQAIKDAWRTATANSRDVAVMGADLTHTQIQVDPKDSQFIDLMRFEVEQACRFWRVPPSMVYGAISGESVTYANVTEADVNFLKHSLDGYYVRVEYALSDILPRPQFVKLNRNAILRADVKARSEAYTVQLQNRTLTVNEVRRLEDLPPFGPEFDEPGIPPMDSNVDLSAMVRNMVNGVGVILTADEARELLNESGADLPPEYPGGVPAPVPVPAVPVPNGKMPATNGAG